MIRSIKYLAMRALYDAGRAYVKSEVKKQKAAAIGAKFEQWRAAVAVEWPAKPGTAAHLDTLLQVPEVADILRRLLQVQYARGKEPSEAAQAIWSKLWH